MRYLKLLSIIVLFALTSKSFAMFCPNNFNSIEIGDTIDLVINKCGKPDRKDSYQRKIKFHQGIGNAVQQYSDTMQKDIEIIKFIYTNQGSQPAILIFENGILVDRQLIPK